MQLEQAKLSNEMKKTEMEVREDPESEDEKDAGPTLRGNRGPQNLARQTKRFGDTMRHVLPKMSQDSAELPQFFETVEKLYKRMRFLTRYRLIC